MAIEPLKEPMNVFEISSKFKVYPTQISNRKQDFLEMSEIVFDKELPLPVSFENKE